MTHLLIAFDGSPPAVAAVDRAAALFPGARATVVGAAGGLGALGDAASFGRVGLSADVAQTAVGRLRDSALDAVREVARRGAEAAGGAGLQATALAVEADGSVRDALLAAGRDAGVDAFVCGTRGHGRAARAILGSVSSGLAQRADAPVLIVPADAGAADGPLLIGFDDSDEARHAIDATGKLMPERDALVAHAWRSQLRHTISGDALRLAPLAEIREITGDLDSMLGDLAAETAEKGAEAARRAGLRARATTVETDGPASEALLDAADENASQALVVGRRGRNAVAAAVLGSVTSSLLHSADRPVLVA